MLSENTMQRLAFLKRVHGVAIRQSRMPGPSGGIAILSFHDSIELFLRLAAEYLGVEKKHVAFMAYWDAFASANPPVVLTQREAIFRLNRARVDLKHYGTFPSELDLDGFRANATHFFEENTPLVFNIGFGDVSMAQLVHNPEAREWLGEADALINESNTEQASVKIAEAFVKVIRDFAYRQSLFIVSPFFLDATTAEHRVLTSALRERGEAALASSVQKMCDSVSTLADAMQVLTMGLDYRGYCEFRLKIRCLNKFPGSGYDVIPDRALSLKPEDCRFCYDFVIESALRLQEFLPLHEGRTEQANAPGDVNS